MALREIFVSDLSGEEINNGESAKVTISLTSAPAKVFVLDVKESEITALLTAATVQTKRGRKPKSK